MRQNSLRGSLRSRSRASAFGSEHGCSRSSLLGETATNLRKIFDYATSQPVVLLLDEFDAIARLRDDQTLNGELRLVVNSLLIQIDKFRG